MKTRIYIFCIAIISSILIPARSKAADFSIDIFINSSGDAYYDTRYYESDDCTARILTDRVASIVRLTAYEWERLFAFYLDELRYSRGGIMARGFTSREDAFIRHLLCNRDYRTWRGYVVRRVRPTPPPPPPARHAAPPVNRPHVAHAPSHSPAPSRHGAKPEHAPQHGPGSPSGHSGPHGSRR